MTITAQELREIVANEPSTADLSAEAVKALASIAERVFTPAGQRIRAVGDQTDAVLIIEHGRAGTIGTRGGKTLRIDNGRGAWLGLNPVLQKAPSEVDIFALRDCTLLRLPAGEVLECFGKHTELIGAYSKGFTEVLWRTHGVRSGGTRPQTFAFLPVRDDTEVLEAADTLRQALVNVAGPGSLVDRRRLTEILGRSPSQAEPVERERVMRWYNQEEAKGHFLLFVCDTGETHWTRWCLEQTDRIIVAVKADDTSEIERIDRIFAGRSVAGSPIRVELLLVHHKDTDLPDRTRAWTNLECMRRHHHVRQGNITDFARAARRMSDRSVGLVLGGGGARALAHIGVLQALEEAGVPVDVIGGTSMGSVIAATYARGWSPMRILELMRTSVPSSKALTDIDFPMISFLAGRKLRKVLQSTFEPADVLDMWIPFYCISASLTEARMIVHDQGPLALSLQASCALPGIFPPVYADGQLLVDGGLMNNIPMDVMNRLCPGGTIIAVDVGSGGARNLKLNEREELTGWRLLGNKLNPLARKHHIANLVQILTWSTTLSASQYVKEMIDTGRADLFLRPPVQGFELLGFDAHQKLYEIGYECTRNELANWDRLEKVVNPQENLHFP